MSCCYNIALKSTSSRNSSCSYNTGLQIWSWRCALATAEMRRRWVPNLHHRHTLGPTAGRAVPSPGKGVHVSHHPWGRGEASLQTSHSVSTTLLTAPGRTHGKCGRRQNASHPPTLKGKQQGLSSVKLEVIPEYFVDNGNNLTII